MLSNNQNIIFNDITELVFLGFCMVRFMAVSPFVTIMEQLLYLSDDLYDQVKQYSVEYIKGDAAKPGKKTEIYYLTEYINRMILTPYEGSVQGSSLEGSLRSINSVDLPTVWADIVAGR